MVLASCISSNTENTALQTQNRPATCQSSTRLLTTARSSSRASYTPPLPNTSFTSARRMMRDFSRTISPAVDVLAEEREPSKQRFEIHRELEWMRKTSVEKRKSITRRTSFLPGSDREIAKHWRQRWYRLWSTCSILFIFLDLTTLPMKAFGLEYGMLDALMVSFWALHLLGTAVSCLPERRRRRFLDLAAELLLLSTRLASVIRPAAAASHLAWGGLSLLQLARVLALPHFYEASGVAALVHDGLRKAGREARASWNLACMGLGSLVCLHCLTCAWFAVGSEATGWAEEMQLIGLPWHAQYVRSMEWAPCQAENLMSQCSFCSKLMAEAAPRHCRDYRRRALLRTWSFTPQQSACSPFSALLSASFLHPSSRLSQLGLPWHPVCRTVGFEISQTSFYSACRCGPRKRASLEEPQDHEKAVTLLPI